MESEIQPRAYCDHDLSKPTILEILFNGDISILRLNIGSVMNYIRHWCGTEQHSLSETRELL
jgi:hypothetical protein